MCSIYFSTSPVKNLDHINEFNRRRGPDYTNVITRGEHVYLHNLLSITGKFCLQPFVKGDIVCMYNGEIYNADDLVDEEIHSDGQVLIPAYEKYGNEFIQKLDGEFAILLVDYAARKLIVSSDTFATKPLYINADFRYKKDICISSYHSPIIRSGYSHALKFAANTTAIINIDTLEVEAQMPVTVFDASNQHKDNYDDWISCFERSIKKRCANIRERAFVGLSSGYDSGAIVAEMTKQDTDFKAYTIRGSENLELLNERYSRIKAHELMQLYTYEYQFHCKFINEICEDFVCPDKPDEEIYNIKADKASVGLSAICLKARYEGRKINISGQGSDEILSDYGFQGKKHYPHSEFGGLFPEDLESIFPWRSFYGGTQLCYLNKDEHVSGAHGVETRYPFLDVELVQEFLWLTVDCKNRHYKGPLHQYLVQSGMPFELGQKTGFGANLNLVE